MKVTQEYENCYIPISNDAEAFSKGSNWSVDILQYLEGCTSNPQLTKRNLQTLLEKDYKDFKSVENIEDRTQIVIDNIRKCVGNKDKPMKLFLVELYTECKVQRDNHGGIGQLHCISIDCRGDDEKDWLIIDGMVYRKGPLEFSLDNLIEVQKYSVIKGEKKKQEVWTTPYGIHSICAICEKPRQLKPSENNKRARKTEKNRKLNKNKKRKKGRLATLDE